MPVEQLTKPDGTPIQVAVRPEKFALTTEKPEQGHAISATMANTAYLGERSHYYVRIEGKHDPVAVSVPNQHRGGGGALEEGAPVWLSWSAESIVILDAD